MIEPADSNSMHRAGESTRPTKRLRQQLAALIPPPLRQPRLWQLSLVRTLLLGTTDPGSLLWPLRLEDRAEPLLDNILGLLLVHWESEVCSLLSSGARADDETCCRPTTSICTRRLRKGACRPCRWSSSSASRLSV